MPKIAVILTPSFADWEYAYIAGTGGPFYGMDVAFFAPLPGEVVSQGGLTAKVSRDTSEIAGWKPDVVVVVGGMGWDQEGAPDVSDVLAAQRDRGGTVAGICGGTLGARPRRPVGRRAPHIQRSGLPHRERHRLCGLFALRDIPYGGRGWTDHHRARNGGDELRGGRVRGGGYGCRDCRAVPRHDGGGAWVAFHRVQPWGTIARNTSFVPIGSIALSETWREAGLE